MPNLEKQKEHRLAMLMSKSHVDDIGNKLKELTQKEKDQILQTQNKESIEDEASIKQQSSQMTADKNRARTKLRSGRSISKSPSRNQSGKKGTATASHGNSSRGNTSRSPSRERKRDILGRFTK